MQKLDIEMHQHMSAIETSRVEEEEESDSLNRQVSRCAPRASCCWLIHLLQRELPSSSPAGAFAWRHQNTVTHHSWLQERFSMPFGSRSDNHYETRERGGVDRNSERVPSPFQYTDYTLVLKQTIKTPIFSSRLHIRLHLELRAHTPPSASS